jgi:hypothetical protein
MPVLKLFSRYLRNYDPTAAKVHATSVFFGVKPGVLTNQLIDPASMHQDGQATGDAFS